jgi:ADP-ribosyl-[dinitrogen reductase] hydrolase
MNTTADNTSKLRGAMWGLYIGDALAMPVHWYYNRNALFEDYGCVTDYVAPPQPAPGQCPVSLELRGVQPHG